MPLPLNHIAHASVAPLYLGLGAILATVAMVGLAGTTLFSAPLDSGAGADTPTPVPSPTTDPIYRKVAELQGTRIARDLTPRPTSTPEETPAPTMTVAVPLDCEAVTPGPVPVSCVWATPTNTPPPPAPTCATPVPRMACLMPTATRVPTSSEVMVE